MPDEKTPTTSSFRSVVELFHHRVDSTPDADAMYGRRGETWYTWKWREVGQRARRLACGLRSLGLERGQRCAILAKTRPEWVLADMAILAAGGATTTIYPSNLPDECAYILENSGSIVCFAENPEQAEKLLSVRESLPRLQKIILLEGRSSEALCMDLEALEELGATWDAENPGAYEAGAEAVGPEDLATLIYTSGTTGKPKGVMLTHDAWVYEAEAIDTMGLLQPSDKHYLFLPLAHSFAKVLEIAFIRVGVPTAVDGDIDQLVPNLAAVQPTVMAAVPRIFEKVYNKVVSGAREAGSLRYRIFRWAVRVGAEVSALRQRGREPVGPLAIKARIADRLVFSKLQRTFGGRIKFFISGGAPLSREIAEFLHGAGILVLEGYGLTESSAASFVNRPDDYRFGTVGKPVPGTEVTIAEDGEILIRGRGVMRGYYRLPEATAEALDDGGWLHTGDIGIIDDRGFLKITDRKKDIIVTAGGKNIAPQKIENLLKVHCEYISQVVVHGDKRNFCSALITIDEETTGRWARERGIDYGDYAQLAGRPEVHELIWEAVQEVNRELASYETIKKIAILDRDFSIESGELTPKMSVKRRVVERNYAEILDGFYSGTIEAI